MNLFGRHDELEKALIDCQRRMDAGASLQSCLDLYPQLAPEIEAHLQLTLALSQVDIGGPPALVSQNGRRALLTALSVAPTRAGKAVLSPARGVAAALGLGALVLVVAGTGASAAGLVDPPRPVAQVLNSLGVESNEHGKAVSEDVQEAIDSTTPGPDRGKAVSEAACNAAHDRENLPEGAKLAPGQADKEPKDCEHPNSDGTPGAAPDVLPQQDAEDSQNPGRADPPGRSPNGNPGQDQRSDNAGSEGASEPAEAEDTPDPAHTPPSNPGQGPPETLPPTR